MRDAFQFRGYAQECRRLAQNMPAHKAALLRIADAWIACAEEAEATINRRNDATHIEIGPCARPAVVSLRNAAVLHFSLLQDVHAQCACQSARACSSARKWMSLWATPRFAAIAFSSCVSRKELGNAIQFGCPGKEH
jgi:hypothetical protein